MQQPDITWLFASLSVRVYVCIHWDRKELLLRKQVLDLHTHCIIVTVALCNFFLNIAGYDTCQPTHNRSPTLVPPLNALQYVSKCFKFIWVLETNNLVFHDTHFCQII